jgi:hypothetical protein
MNIDYKWVEEIKERYPKGTRIEVDFMADPYHPVGSGMRGTVRLVDDMGTVHCNFDNGRRMGLILGEDSFRIVED